MSTEKDITLNYGNAKSGLMVNWKYSHALQPLSCYLEWQWVEMLFLAVQTGSCLNRAFFFWQYNKHILDWNLITGQSKCSNLCWKAHRDSLRKCLFWCPGKQTGARGIFLARKQFITQFVYQCAVPEVDMLAQSHWVHKKTLQNHNPRHSFYSTPCHCTPPFATSADNNLIWGCAIPLHRRNCIPMLSELHCLTVKVTLHITVDI